MTTLISLAARDFIVVGCDSLATTMADLVYPGDLASEFFDASGNLKTDADGKPILNAAHQLWDKAQRMPVDNLPSVTKLYDLEPYRACLLFSGAARIGETTIGNLVATFKSKLPSLVKKSGKKQDVRTPYTMEWLAKKLEAFILEIYQAEFPAEQRRPTMDLILSGYSEAYREPELWRIKFTFDRQKFVFETSAHNQIKRQEYSVIFGGQYDVVQRIVNGIDDQSYFSLRERMVKILEEHFVDLEQELKLSHPDVSLTKPNFWGKKYNPFEDDQGGVTRVFPDVGSLSEQAGIDLVYFLVSAMIQAQSFAQAIPTVGGKIHVAMLTKDTPFRWISEEAHTFEGRPIPKFPNHA